MKLNPDLFPHRVIGTFTPLRYVDVQERDGLALGEHNLFHQEKVEDEVIAPFGWWFWLVMNTKYLQNIRFVSRIVHDNAASPPDQIFEDRLTTTIKTPQNVTQKQKRVKQDLSSLHQNG